MAVPATRRGERKASRSPAAKPVRVDAGLGRDGRDDVGGGHRDSLVRGSMKPCSRSTTRLAPSTANVMTRKMPCISG